MDINFCILMFYIFFRNFKAFDKELAIFYGFFNLRISKNNTPLERSSKLFFFNFRLILYQTYILLFKSAKFYVLNQSRSILLVPPKYTLKNEKIWSLFINFGWRHHSDTWPWGITLDLLETTNDPVGLGKFSFYLIEYFRF